MKIGRRSTLEEMDSGGWGRFAAGAGLGLPLVRRRVTELSWKVRMQVEEVAGDLMKPGLDVQALVRLTGTLASRAK